MQGEEEDDQEVSIVDQVSERHESLLYAPHASSHPYLLPATFWVVNLPK